MINTSDNKIDERDSDYPVVCFRIICYLRESCFYEKCLKLSSQELSKWAWFTEPLSPDLETDPANEICQEIFRGVNSKGIRYCIS